MGDQTMGGKSLVTICLVCLLVSFCVSETIKVRERCDKMYCSDGNCEDNQLELGNCKPFCSTCTNLCSLYYLINPTNNENEYLMMKYDDPSCTHEVSRFEVVCSSCQLFDYASDCITLYLDCSGDWWMWVLLAFFAILILVGVIFLALIIWKKKKQEEILATTPVERVSAQQASYQSQSGSVY